MTTHNPIDTAAYDDADRAIVAGLDALARQDASAARAVLEDRIVASALAATRTSVGVGASPAIHQPAPRTGDRFTHRRVRRFAGLFAVVGAVLLAASLVPFLSRTPSGSSDPAPLATNDDGVTDVLYALAALDSSGLSAADELLDDADAVESTLQEGWISSELLEQGNL